MNEEKPYFIVEPNAETVPIVISVPHCGIEFPEDIKKNYLPKHVEFPEDTDWLVDKLYDFAPSMGITVIKARYSRYVIDLNRDPNQAKLYHDGRTESSLVPTKNFSLEKLYINDEPTELEVRKRLEKYYWPYYHAISKTINDLKVRFSNVLLYDAHSIRRQVASISDQKFPDLMLGSNYSNSAEIGLIDTAMKHLSKGPYSVVKDKFFAGGHITRFFGRPDQGVHALQLERCWDLYLQDNPRLLDQRKSSDLSLFLRSNLEALANKLKA